MSKISNKFENLSLNTTKLYFKLLQNQNLMRYIHYLNEHDPLDQRLPDVSPSKVKENNFVLTRFNEEVIVDAKILFFLSPLRGRFTHSVLSTDVYEIFISIPREHWVIGNGSKLRPFQIAKEIANSLDHKHVAGIGDVIISDWSTMKANNSCDGILLLLQVTNGTIKG